VGSRPAQVPRALMPSRRSAPVAIGPDGPARRPTVPTRSACPAARPPDTRGPTVRLHVRVRASAHPRRCCPHESKGAVRAPDGRCCVVCSAVRCFSAGSGPSPRPSSRGNRRQRPR
jgi:hypothetical protein